MRWLIIEDALESLKGHWYECIQGYHQELPLLDDELTLLVSRRAEPFIVKSLGALAILPESLPLRQSRVGKMQRFVRAFTYFISSYRVIARFVRNKSDFDLIYVPDVTILQLLVWACLVKAVLCRKKSRVLLFFLGLPISGNGKTARLNGSLTSKAMRRLLRFLAPEIRTAQVVLGVEVHAMKQAAEAAFGLPFTCFPHPVRPSTLNPRPSALLTMACYGPARHEKGSDVLVAAIKTYLERFPGSRTRFVFQWMEDFKVPDGSFARVPEELRGNPRVEIIGESFSPGVYAGHLVKTDVLLLPYRKSSYGLRGSRVVVEAMVNALPMVATEGTTLHEQMQQYGAGLSCRDGDVDSLVSAIREMELRYAEFQKQARDKRPFACEHYSLRTFRDLLLSAKQAVCL